MAPYLEHLANAGLVTDQHDLLARLKQLNDDELKRINDKLDDATSNLGETEISDALREKATYLARIGEKVRPASLFCMAVPPCTPY